MKKIALAILLPALLLTLGFMLDPGFIEARPKCPGPSRHCQTTTTSIKDTLPPTEPPTLPPTEPTSTTSTTTSTTSTTVPGAPAGWTLTIDENFDIPVANKAEFDATYPARNIKRYPDHYPDTRSNQGKSDGGFYNAPIDVSDGVLRCHMDVVNGRARVCAIVPLAKPGNGTWGDAPGMILEQRARFTYTNGFKSANLLWPQSNNGLRDGEIDYVEFEARNPVEAFIHHQGATSGGDQKWFPLGVNPYEWHTYRLVWEMGQRVRIYVDGALKADYATRIPATPMHAVLQNETWLTSLAVPSTATGLVEYDSVKIWVPG